MKRLELNQMETTQGGAEIGAWADCGLLVIGVISLGAVASTGWGILAAAAGVAGVVRSAQGCEKVIFKAK